MTRRGTDPRVAAGGSDPLPTTSFDAITGSEDRRSDESTTGQRSRRRRRWAGVAVVMTTALMTLGYLLVPFTAQAQVACGASGGVVAWELGGAERQRNQAATDEARMQEGLDSLQHDPATAETPLGRELIEDARDEMTSAEAKDAAIDACGTEASGRIERGALGAIALIATVLGAAHLVSWLHARWQRRHEGSGGVIDHRQSTDRCPHCGALLEEPLGCWNCGGFRDGQHWRFPAQAPPDQARSIAMVRRHRPHQPDT